MGGAQLAYVIVYVQDVNKAADFYSKAFGLQIRPQNKTNSWVEMETGTTTLAFTPAKQREHAIDQGASPVAGPEDKVWQQKVCYVKDINGNVVRLGSFVAK
uniref:Glyoxalase/fosfomycin resistance/dioxygenase domain-containing protein n=1 Tax=Physcomitrium patens TaxID=3218 RepID=A0A7I4BJB9_PHYPA